MFWLILLVGFFLVNMIVMAIFGVHIAGDEDAEMIVCVVQTLIELGLVKAAMWLCEHVTIIF